MPKEVKTKSVVLEDAMTSGYSRHDPSSPTLDRNNPDTNFTPTDQNKNAIGKHILPTVMVAQQQCSRVALPLNDLSSNNVSLATNKLKEDEQIRPNYPNVVVETDSRNDQSISKPKSVDNTVSTTTPTSSNVRRKKSIPVRRKSTITDDCKLQNVENDIIYKNPQSKIDSLAEKLYTRHNGLELLWAVGTITTAPSTPTSQSSPSISKAEAVTSSYEKPLQILARQGHLGVPDVPEAKVNSLTGNSTSIIDAKPSLYSPINAKLTPAQKISNSAESREFEQLYYQPRQFQMHNNMQPIRTPPLPYDYATYSKMPYLSAQRDPNSYRQVPQAQVTTPMTQYNLNHLQQDANETVLRKARLHKGVTSEHVPRIPQNGQPHTFYQSHHLIANPSVAREHLHLNRYTPNIPVSQEGLNHIQANQKILNPDLVSQQPSPRKANIDTNMQSMLLQQHYQQQNPYVNQYVSPPYDRQVAASPNLYSSVESRQNLQVPHQPQNNYISSEFYDLLNSREPQQWQRETSNPSASSVTSQTSRTHQNNINDIDRNQVVTLYYESQNAEAQNESNRQTIVYAEVPGAQSSSSSNTSQQVNQRDFSAKQLPNSKEPTNYDGFCVPVTITNSSKKGAEESSTVGRVFLECLPETLANMIAEKVNNSNQALDEKQKSVSANDSNVNVKISGERLSPQKPIRQTTPSVIIQNSSVLTSANRKTPNFSHRIENIISSTSSSDANTLGYVDESPKLDINLMSCAAMGIANNTAEYRIQTPIDVSEYNNGLPNQNFGTKSVICRNFVNQNKYDSISNRVETIKPPVSVNETTESVLNLTTSHLSTDSKRERRDNEIQNRIEHNNVQNFVTAKSVICENVFDQNKCNSDVLNNSVDINNSLSANQHLESAINLSSSISENAKREMNENAPQNKIQVSSPIYKRLPYLYNAVKSKTHANLTDENECDPNDSNYFKNRFDSINENTESAINLTISSATTNITTKTAEENTVNHTVQETAFVNSVVLNDDRNLMTKSKTPENLINTNNCDNIHTQNANNTICVIVDAKTVKHTSDESLNTETSPQENVEKQVETTSNENTESVHTINNNNEKQVTNIEALNGNIIPDNKSHDSGKIASSNLDTEKCNGNKTNNEEEEESNIRCSSSMAKDQEGLESINSSTTIEDQVRTANSKGTHEPSDKEQKKSSAVLSDNNTNTPDDVTKKEDLPRETINSNSREQFPVETEFASNDAIENIFGKIMPSCFLILNLVQQMQDMDNINWWPVDVSGNLLKIKLSLRDISLFLKKSKQLAAHLDPYIHYIFLFLLEWLRTFRERVRVLVDTDYSLKANYISMTECQIYKDVFIQLYGYLCCTRVTDYVNFILKNDMCLPTKREDCLVNESMIIPRNNVEFSHVRQKHMLIVEKIKQQQNDEEERNECFKKFLSSLDRQLSERTMSSDEMEIDETAIDTNKQLLTQDASIKQVSNSQKPNSTEHDSPRLTSPVEANRESKDDEPNENLKHNNGTTQSIIAKETLKRPIECIVIDSDSDEEKQNSERTCVPAKKLKPTKKNMPKRVSCIINLDDDGEVSEINETMNNKENNNNRQLIPDNLDSNKSNCSKSPQLQTYSPSMGNKTVVQDNRIEESFNRDCRMNGTIVNKKVENKFTTENAKLNADTDSEANKDDISEKMKNMLKTENGNKEGMVSNESQANTEKANCADLEISDIKEEIKRKDEELLLEISKDNNLKSNESNVIEEEEEATSLIDKVNESNKAVSDISNKSRSNTTNITESSLKTIAPNVEEADETVEAIKIFLRETEANDRNNAKVIPSDNILLNSDKTSSSENFQSDTIAERLISNTNISAFSSQANHNNENKLVGIATPNVKDSDVSNKKTNQPIKSVSDINLINVLQNSAKEIEDEIIADKTKTKDLDDQLLMDVVDTEMNTERTIIQKLISFRKPFRKSSTSIEDSLEYQVSSEPNSEVNEKGLSNYSDDTNSVEDNLKEIETSKVMQPQNTLKEVNNNLGNIDNQNVNAVPSSGKEVNLENAPIVAMDSAHQNREKTTLPQLNVEMRRHSIDGYHQPHVEHQYAIQENPRCKLQDGISTQPKLLKRSASQTHEYSAAFKYRNLLPNHDMDSENNTTIQRHANMAISDYFLAQELLSRHRSNPPRADASRRLSSDYKNMNPATKAPVVTETARDQHHQPPNTVRTDNGKELLRQAITRRQANQQNLQHTAIPPTDKRKEQHKTVSSRIPTLQSIYNESVNTNGFISQYIKDEIGVLSKKESLGPVEYVGEISTLMRLPSIPKDFKDFYVFVTKQQILQFHQPIAFHIFLELLNQSGLKDYHKKFTEYTKRKCEDNVRFRKDSQLQQVRTVTR